MLSLRSIITYLLISSISCEVDKTDGKLADLASGEIANLKTLTDEGEHLLKSESSHEIDSSSSSIRRYPQYQPSSPVGSSPFLLTDSAIGSPYLPRQASPQVISVLSGASSPHQSVTWNPPATINPPPVNYQTAPQPLPDRSARFYQAPPQPPPPPPPPAPVESPVDFNQPRNQLPVSQPAVSTSSSSVSTNTTGKKDDLVIYYYYYYDDEDGKNTTKVTAIRDPNAANRDPNVGNHENLDTIPSLEQFDNADQPPTAKSVTPPNPSPTPSVAQPSTVHFNPNFTPTTASPLPQHPSVSPAANFFQGVNFGRGQGSVDPVERHRFVHPVLSSTVPSPVTDVSVSVSVSSQENPVSNTFRYGSSAGQRPSFDSVRVGGVAAAVVNRNSAFSPAFPGQGFRHLPSSQATSAAVQPVVTSPFPTVDPRHFYHSTGQPRAKPLPPQVQPITLPPTSPTEAQTTFSIATTTTTTERPTEEPSTEPPVTEAPLRGRRPSFGTRRNRFGSNQNRVNPLQRARATASTPSQATSTTTTTTTTPRPRPRTYGNPSLRRPTVNNRLANRRRPAEPVESTGSTEASDSASSVSPVSPVSPVTVASTAAPVTPRRFGAGNRVRFGISRPPYSPPSTSTTTTISPLSTSSASITPRSPIRRPQTSFSSTRNRGRGRPNFYRPRKQEEEPTEAPKMAEVSSSSDQPVESPPVSSPATETNSVSANPPPTGESNANNEKPSGDENENSNSASSSSAAPSVPSSTDRSNLFNRQRPRNPLFRSRPRPKLFESRRTSSNDSN